MSVFFTMLLRFIILIGFVPIAGWGQENFDDSSRDSQSPLINVPVPFEDEETDDSFMQDDNEIIISGLSQDNLLVNA